MKAKTVMNKIIIVGGLECLSAAWRLWCRSGSGCDICRKHGCHTGKHRSAGRKRRSERNNRSTRDCTGRSTAS